jgi:hypothetical protein
VNRHDHDPDTSHYITEERMTEDIAIAKRIKHRVPCHGQLFRRTLRLLGAITNKRLFSNLDDLELRWELLTNGKIEE